MSVALRTSGLGAVEMACLLMVAANAGCGGAVLPEPPPETAGARST
jgi:hypothetical protein